MSATTAMPGAEKCEWTLNRDGDVVILRWLDANATEARLPDKIEGRNVVEIAQEALAGSWARRVILPKRLRKIESDSFCDCAFLLRIDFPASLEEIGDDAFAGCSSLKLVSFKSKVNRWGLRVFDECEALRVVVAPGGEANLEERAYPVCRRLEVLDFSQFQGRTRDGVVYSSDGKTLLTAFEWKNRVAVPDGVERIDERAFDKTLAQGAIATIPASVVEIGEGAFSNQPALTIRGERDSYADRYAKRQGIRFEPAGL